MNFNSPQKVLFLSILMALSALPANSTAADKKDKSARRMQQMVQKIQQEKSELQTQIEQERQAKAGLEDEFKKTAQAADALKGNLSAANRKAGSLASELQRVKAENLANEAKLQQAQTLLESTQKNLSDLTLQYQSAQQDIKASEREKTALAADLSQKDKGLHACETKNSKLYGFGLELVKMYERPSTYQAILRTELFTQIKRVELENIFQDYNDKLDDERIITGKR